MKELNHLQKSFIDSIAKGVCKVIKDGDIAIEKKNALSISDAETISKFGIEVSDSGVIKDNMPYVEYELVKVSQRLFERPQANQPWMEILTADGDGSNDESIIYKFIDYKGGFTQAVDKGSSNSIVSTKHGAEAYPIHTLNAYLESVSLRELAVALAKGYALPERRLRAMYVSFVKTMNNVIFAGTDNAGKSVSKYKASGVPGSYVKTSASTLSALILAGDTTEIYDLFLDVISTMEANGEKNDGEFTPNVCVLPVKQYSELKTLMKNSGYFNMTVKEYLEKMLNLTFYAYAPLKEAGAAGVDRAILMNTSSENMFYGMPNGLSMYSDTKFDEQSEKATFRTSGLIVINSGAFGYIDNV